MGHRSASFLQSLTTALVLGATAAFIGVAASAALYYRHIPWFASAAVGPLVGHMVVVCLATIALEQSRKRSIRRTLETSFLNHHVRNTLVQMIMAADLTDTDKQDRYMREAVSRISEALFRVANSAEVSLEVDIAGSQLNTAERKSVKNKGTVRTARQADFFHRHLSSHCWNERSLVMKATDSDLSNDEGARITEFIPKKRQSSHEKRREGTHLTKLRPQSDDRISASTPTGDDPSSVPCKAARQCLRRSLLCRCGAEDHVFESGLGKPDRVFGS